MLDLADFILRLKQVIAWTEQLSHGFDLQNGNYGLLFRQLIPVVEGQLLFSDRPDFPGYFTWNVDVYNLDYFRQALHVAFEQRNTQVNKSSFKPGSFQKLGRILYFETGLTTHDGAAIIESNCFVDESDVPPIDTWFYLDNEKENLFCWIPRQFEPLIEKAISVEIFGSYHWLDEAGPLTHQQIVAAMSA